MKEFNGVKVLLSFIGAMVFIILLLIHPLLPILVAVFLIVIPLGVAFIISLIKLLFK